MSLGNNIKLYMLNIKHGKGMMSCYAIISILLLVSDHFAAFHINFQAPKLKLHLKNGNMHLFEKSNNQARETFDINDLLPKLKKMLAISISYGMIFQAPLVYANVGEGDLPNGKFHLYK